MQAVVNPTLLKLPMQLLCHWLEVLWHQGAGSMGRVCLVLAIAFGVAPAMAQTDKAAPGQDKLLTEVAQWAQQSLRLGAEDFSFAPIDPRVQLQTCDRPLVMDSPFATRETVRVRCLGSPYWQLYMRLVLKPGVTLASVTSPPPAPARATPPPAPAVSAPAPIVSAPALVAPPAPKAPAASAPVVMRKVVVARQLLRTGTAVTADMLEEEEVSAAGVDLQAVTSIKDLEYGEMVREIQAGVPLRSHDVRRAILVKQGQSVILTIGQSGGFAISARVEALQDGKMGEQIRLKNPESGRIITGVVTGSNTARGLLKIFAKNPQVFFCASDSPVREALKTTSIHEAS